MKQIVAVSLAVMLAGTKVPLTQRRSVDAPAVVSLPQDFDTRSCRLQYLLAGSFGGYGGFVQPKLESSAYEIETVHDGVSVERLKGFLACPGYQTETIAFDFLGDLAPWTVRLQPRPLGTVRFSGIIRGLLAQDEPVLNVDISYIPSWSCEFFGLIDCQLVGLRIATAPLGPENRFSVLLPDFARDAVVSSFQNRGEFVFRILQSKAGNVLYELNSIGDTSGSRSLPVASAYPRELTFEAALQR